MNVSTRTSTSATLTNCQSKSANKTFNAFNRWIMMTIVAIFALFSSLNSFSQVFNSSGTYTVPAGVTSIQVYLWGGGGAGAGTNTAPSCFHNGGGGGGGACVLTTIGVTPGDVYTVTVGAGGVPNSTGAVAGSGGTTTFTGPAGTWTAAGGAGAAATSSATSATNAGGAGGTLGTGPGITTFTGGNGSIAYNGSCTGDFAGIGGGGAGSGGNGQSQAATIANGGCLGAAAGGIGTFPGGAGGYNNQCGVAGANQAGSAGTAPGGGGSGVINWSPQTLLGGAGAAGRVTIIAPCITPGSQPTSLLLGASATVVNGSFTLAPGVVNYLVVRYPGGSTPTAPVDLTTYTVGGSLGTGTVVSTSSNTFSTTGLTSGTTYDFYVYSMVSVCSGSSPLYLASSPLFGSVTTAAFSGSTALGGLWSSPATWASGIVPPAGENVVIAAGATVTVDQVVTNVNLTVNGTLQWNATANAMTLTGNVLINSGGKILAYTTGLVGVTMNVAGNFTNNGFANFAAAITSFSALVFNGSGSTLDGTGTFAGNGTDGIIRFLSFANLGSNTINTSQNIIANSFAHTAGSLNTNGKLKIDNTAQVYGQALNQQVAGLVVTNMGSLYNAAPVVFGAAVTQWSNITGTLNTLYVSGSNVYRCTTVGNIGPSAPTHTSGIAQNLLWIGTVGTLGNPFQVTANSVGTQYFYGNNLYTCISTASVPDATNPPTCTSGTCTSGGTVYLYAGTAATATVNYDATTQTVRSLNLTSAGSGLTGAPTAVISVGVLGGTGSGAVVTAVFIQQMIGTANSTTQKTTGLVITGGITINSDQGTSVATLNGQASSGVGAISTSNGGVNYTVAPTLGFTLPTALNLITNPGSGYTAVPTITVTGGNLISGSALTSSNFTITVNQGKVESVYLSGGSGVYSTLPTLALTASPGTTALLAFPATCLPVATANISPNGQLTSFTITNPGYGYVAAPTVGIGTTTATANGGTFTTVANTPTARIALYNLIYNFFAPATAATANADDATIPASRKINSLALNGNGNGLNLANNLTIFGSTTPLTLVASLSSPGNIINLGGFNLNFTWNGYGGTTSTFASAGTNAYIKNGSMSLVGRGGASTFNFPFAGLTTSGGFTWFAGSTPTTITTGSTVTNVTVTETAAPSGAAAIGNRAYLVNANGSYGTNPTVTMHYNTPDALPTGGNATDLFISQSAALTGPWTPRSVSSGSGTVGTTGSRVTASVAPGPLVPTGTDYFAWTSVTLNYANVSVQPATCAATAHLVSADITTSLGTLSSVTITYNNGAAGGPTAMTNTTGNTWQFTIPAASPTNSIVTWSITATNSVGISKTFTGTSYQDDATNGVTATATASVNPVCSGSPSVLTAVFNRTGSATIGTASTLTGATTQPTAFCNRWASYRMETIYTAAELTAAGLSAGNITSMAYNITTLGDGATNSGFTVKIGNTALTAFTAFVPTTTGFTTVFPSATYTHAVGVNVIPFSTPFAWDGVSNIIIEVIHNGADLTNNAITFYTATALNTVAYTAVTSADAASLSTNRLNITFTGNNAPAFTTVTWNNGTSNIGTGNPFTINPTSTLTYTATGTTAAGCSISTTGVTVTASTLPAAPVGSNSSQCGDHVPTASVISGGQNGKFRWYNASTGGTLLQNGGATYTTSVNTTTTFYVSESANVDGTGCESLRSPVTVTVNLPDPISATPSNSNPCTNTQISLTAANIAGTPTNIYTYTWTATPQAGSGLPVGGTVGTSINVTPTVAGTYVYTASAVDGSCATSANTVNVVVKALPNILSATATPASYCNGGSSNLVATTVAAAPGFATVGTSTTSLGGSDGNPYRSGNGTGNQIRTQLLVTAAQLTAAGVAPGNITSLGFTTTGNGGTVDNFTIQMGATAATALSATFETTSMTTVFTQPTFTAVLGLNTHTFTTPFNWNGTSNIIINICQTNDILGTNTVAAFTPPTSSDVHKSGSTTGCTDLTGTVVAAMPIMTFGAQVGTVGAGSLTWTWNPGALSGNSVTVAPTTSTTYTVSAFDPATTCTNTQNVLVTVNPVPSQPTANTGDDLCGTGFPTISLVSNSGLGSPTFHWYSASTGGTLLQNSGSTSYTTMISATTTFWVTEVSAFGCESSPRVSVTQIVNTPDLVTAQANSTSTALSICLGSTINLSALQTGGNGNTYVFTWTATGGANSGLTGSQVGNPINGITPLAVGTYTYSVVAFDDNTLCTATSSVTVTVNPVPFISSATATPGTVCSGSPATLNGHSITSSVATVQIGAGTTPNSSSTTVGAFYGTWYGNGHAQILITAAELSAAGFLPGNLSALSIDVSALAAAPDNTAQGFTIKLASVSAATSAITTFQSPTFTTVYGPVDYTPVLGTNTHTFNAPYAWDGVSNLIVDYCFVSNPTRTGNGSAVNNTTTTSFSSFVNYQADGAAGSGACTTTTVSNTSTSRPNIKFTGLTGVDLTASLSWLWTPGNLSGASVTVNPTTTTDYSVKATNSFGCFVNFSPVHVAVNPLPTAPTANNSTQCGPGVPTASVTSGGGGGGFKWYDALTGGTLLQTGGSTYTTSISGVGVHHFYVSESNGTCESLRTDVTATITAPPTLVVTPGGATTFCNGGTVGLNAATGSDPSYTSFSWSPATGLNTTSGAAVTATPSVTTTYTVTATGGGCTNTATITVTVNPNPAITTHIATPAVICSGGSSVLSATSINAATGVAPTGLATTTTQGGSPFRAGGGSATKTQMLYTAAELTAAGFAPGNFTSLGFNFTTASGGGLPNFQIKMGNTTATTLNGTFEASPSTVVFAPSTVSPPTVTGLFTLTFTSPFNWNGTSNLLIEICHDIPTGSAGSGFVDATTTGTTTDNQLLTTNACTTLPGGTTQTIRPVVYIGGQVGTDMTANYVWTWNPGALGGSTVTVNPTSTTNYSVKATDPATGCFTTYSPVTVTVTTVAGAPSASPAAICAGGSSTLSANATGGAPFTYLWDDPAASTTATISVSPATTTTYHVVIKDACGNPTASLPVTVTVNPLPTVSIAEAGPISQCAPFTQVLTAVTSTGTPAYQWTLNGVNIPGATGSTYTINTVSSGAYSVIVTNTTTTCVSAPAAAVSVTIKPSPTGVTASASVPTICAGDPTNLLGSANTPSPTILTLDFESGLGAWTTTNNSGGTTPTIPAWTIQTNPFTSTNSTPVTFNSGSGSKFILANADLGGSGTTVDVSLISPAFSTMGYSTLAISYSQYYRQYLTSVNVDVTTNAGSSWTTVKTYTADQGTSTAFATDNVDLSAYINNPAVQVRFRYQDGWAWYWALDNIVISGTAPAYSYSWTSTPAGFTSAVQNPTGLTPLATTTYNLLVSSANGCSGTAATTVTVNQCPSTLSLTAFLEGPYRGGGTMEATLFDIGNSTDPTESDNVTVNLWAPTSLSNTTPDYTVTAMLHTNGQATAVFPAGLGGRQYYIAVQHRNHIETWSKLPVTFKPATGYNFSSAQSQAYDDGVNPPMKSVGAGVFAFYAGDINQDGGIDGTDMNVIDNEIGFFGYNISDVNGDGGTDGQDMNFVDNNSQLGLFFARPY